MLGQSFGSDLHCDLSQDAVLVRDHIIHVSTKGVHGDLASCPVSWRHERIEKKTLSKSSKHIKHRHTFMFYIDI